MYKFRAGEFFTRFYIHAIRNGKSEDEAIAEASTKARRAVADLLRVDTSYTATERAVEWAQIIEYLMAFQIGVRELARELPTDRQKMVEVAAEINKAEIAKMRSVEIGSIPQVAQQIAEAEPINNVDA